MSDRPQRSHSSNEQASDHVNGLDIAQSIPSRALAPQSPVVRTQDPTQPDVLQLTGDPTPNHLPNSLNDQMFFFLACTIIGVKVNLLTSSAPPLTPPIRVLTILGLIVELFGAVLVVAHIQPQPGTRTSRQTSREVSFRHTLPIVLILMGIAIFTVAIVLTMFSIKAS